MHIESETFVVIVAAGTGTRFGSDTPKQYLPLCGKPVVCHAIDAFRKALPAAKIILVISQGAQELWRDVCQEYKFDSPLIVWGGDSRSASVKNALDYIACNCHPSDDAVVMVHDGARPMINAELITRTLDGVINHGTAIPVVPLTDALCLKLGSGVVPVDRAAYAAAQTPQAFNFNLLYKAYDSAHGQVMADDAAIVAQYTGRELHTVAGDNRNIKITNPLDITIAELSCSR